VDVGSPSAAASTLQQLGRGVPAAQELCDGGGGVVAVLAGRRAVFNVTARRPRRRRRQRRRFLRRETYDARSRTGNEPLNCLTWDKTREYGPRLRLGF